MAFVPNICGSIVGTKFLDPDFAKAPREYASVEEVPWLLSALLRVSISSLLDGAFFATFAANQTSYRCRIYI